MTHIPWLIEYILVITDHTESSHSNPRQGQPTESKRIRTAYTRHQTLELGNHYLLFQFINSNLERIYQKLSFQITKQWTIADCGLKISRPKQDFDDLNPLLIMTEGNKTDN